MLLLVGVGRISAVTNTATAAGVSWATATWTQGHIPLATEDVVINSGVNITITSAAVCGSLSLGNGTNAVTTLTIGAGGSLVVSGTTGNLAINPLNVASNFTIAVGAQSINVAGNVTFPTSNTSAITISSGTATFANLVTLGTLDNFTITSTATVNFNGGLSDGAGTFTAFNGCTINVAGAYAVSSAPVVFAAGSNFIYKGNGTITPTATITFANFQINSGIAVTLAGAITVGGNWTNNGGTIAGAFDVTFSGAAKTIGGTSGTAFSQGIVFANAATYSLATALTYSASTLTISTGATATSLTHTGTAVLNISGAATINQPTAAVVHAWNINAGSATVSGTLTYVGVTATAGFISQVNVTTGSLTANAVSFAANATNANQVLSLTTGGITITNPFTLGNGTITLTNTGTFTFNGLVTHTGGIIQNTGTAGTYNFAAGYNLSAGTFTTLAAETIKFGGNFTNSFAGGTILNATSTTIFTGTSLITPTTAITFGNLQINSPVALTLAGAITVAGNWTNNGGTVAGAFDVTFSGAGKTIGGTNGTAFSQGIIIANAGSYSLTTALTYSATTLTINAGANATSLTHGGTSVLNISGAVTINQSTAAVVRAWNINAGTASISGTLTYVGVTGTGGFISQVNVTTGSLTANSLSFAANATNANQVLSLTTGSITVTNPFTLGNGTITLTNTGTFTFNGLVTHTGGIIQNTTVAGTYNFAAGYNLSAGTFTTLAAETIKFGGNFTNSFVGGITLNATSTAIFTGTSLITPSTAITFGNFQINSPVAVTLAGGITVAGNWTNNGGTVAGAFDVTFSGAAKTIGGTSGTAFSKGIIFADAATYSLTTALTYSASTLTISAGPTATSLTHNGTAVLNISGAVTINQSTAAVVRAWNINAGSSTVSGTLTYVGVTGTAGFISQVNVTSGSLTANALSFAANATNANQVLSLTTGTITITNPFTLANGTITLTNTGTVTFNGLVTHTGGIIQNTTTAGTYNFAGGYNLSTGTFTTLAAETIKFGGNFTNSFVGGTTLNATSTAIFTGTSLITPTTAITFGNLQINSPVAITLAGAITVAGNWTNNGGTIAGAFDVTFSGAGKTIGGTSGTAFSKGIILANAATYSLATALTYSATTFTINAGATAASLTHTGTAILNISGAVTINQSTAAVVRAWNINGGASTVSGTLTYVGVNASAGFISQVNVTTGSLTATALSFAANATNANQVLSLTTGGITITNPFTLANGTITLTNTGTITFNGLVTHTGGIIQNTGTAGTYNFAGGYNLSTGTLTTLAAETIKFGGNFTNSFVGGTTLNATSTAIFTGTSLITPSTAITFGNLQINSAVAVTMAGAITVGGNWTNNGGTIAGAFDITFSGVGKTIGGTSGTAFSQGIILANAASYSLTTALTYSASTFTINAGATATSLTHSGTAILNISGAVTINQSTGPVVRAWNINGGTASVTGTLTYVGVNATAGRISQVNVTSGALTATALSFAANATNANQVLSLTTGAITITNPYTLANGTITLTNTGTITFNGLITHTGGIIQNSGTAGTYNFAAGYNLSTGTLTTMAAETIKFGGNFTNSFVGGTTLNPTSTEIFTSNSLITPTTAITFGHLQINSAVTVTLAGAITVAGNWTNNGGTVAGVFDVTFSGTGNTIGGTSGTAFSKGIILANAGVYSLATALTYSASTFTINAGPTATSLTHNGTAILNISGAVTINQSTAAVVHAWNINGGTAAVAGTLTYVGVVGTAGFISQVNVTSGALTANALSFAANATNANQVLSLTTGAITVSNPYTLANGTITLTNTGTITFNGLITHTGGIIQNTTTAGTYNFAAGYNLSNGTLTSMAGETIEFGGNFTNSAVGGTVLNSGSTEIFTASGTITPTTNISFGNLQVNTGVAMVSTGNISVAGNWTLNGTGSVDVKTNLTTVTFNGSSPQAISGTSIDFYNMSIATGANVSLSSAQRLINTITLNGTGVFNTNNQFTLVSTATNTGNIATLGTPANFTGSITMQRYVSGAMGYRYIGSAVSGATLSNLTPELQIDGMTGGTNPTYWCNVYTYNEAVAGVFANGWTAATNVTNAMTAGLGFAFYIYSTNIPNTIDLTGTPNKGNQSFSLGYTSSGNADDGWNLVSNPYPSTIDWDAASGWTRTNIQGNAYYAWNDAAQNYASYPAGGPGVNSGTRYIASSQGFMVHNNAAPVLNMTESVKSSTNPTPQFWKATGVNMSPQALRIKLSGNANTYTDESLIRFINGAVSAKDLAYDADKLTSTNPASPFLATLSSDSLVLCVNSQPELTQAIHIPVMINAGAAGTYKIEIERLNDFPSSACLILEDLKTGALTDLRTNPNYSFSLSAGTSPVKRFLLHVTPPVAKVEAMAALCNGAKTGSLIVSNGNSASTSWSYILRDGANNMIASATNISQPDTIRNLKSGTYIISSSNSTGYCSSSTDTILITQPSAIVGLVTASDISCFGMDNGAASVSASGGAGSYSYKWSTGAQGPTVTGLSANIFTLTITDSNACTSATTVSISEGELVTADFTTTSDTLNLMASDSLLFTNTSTGNAFNSWDFGDNTISTMLSPSHVFQSAGIYKVSLNVYGNKGCQASYEHTIVVVSDPLSVAEHQLDPQSYSVNYFDGSIYVKENNKSVSEKISLHVVNAMGQEVFTGENISISHTDPYKIDLPSYAQGIYFVRINLGEKQSTVKIMCTK